jgi:hypothetical protein
MNHQQPILYAASDLEFFRSQAFAIRDYFKSINLQPLPTAGKAMLTIWARCVGYANFDDFKWKAAGHAHVVAASTFRLTPDLFMRLSEALHLEIDTASPAHCRMAIAGLCDVELDEDDVEIIESAVVLLRADVEPERIRKLVDAGLLSASETAGRVYSATDLGKHRAAREKARHRGRPLSRVDLVRLGLPASMSRLKPLHRAVSIAWR